MHSSFMTESPGGPPAWAGGKASAPLAIVEKSRRTTSSRGLREIPLSRSGSLGDY